MDIPFEIIRAPAEMRERARDLRRDGRSICVVPTMGFLHEGHLSLLRAGRKRADVLLLTLFVNPTQFGPNEDLDAYPRDEAGDLAKARACGIDLAFCPDAAAMYPKGHQTHVDIEELSLPLCGKNRPGHFRGVATVVTKLFNITRPDVAIFGQKDFQQLALIRRLNLDLDFGIEIVGMPILREHDGLALSSRNKYLSASQRVDALCLSAGLAAAEALCADGTTDSALLVAAARTAIDATASATVDYVELLDADTLQPIRSVERAAVLAIAVKIGSTRLIDNRVLVGRSAVA